MNYFKNIFRKKTNKNIAVVASLLICNAVWLTSCVKNDSLYSPQEGLIYMPQAYQDRANLTLSYIDSAQTTYFGVASGGFNGASQDVTATFEVDNSLIDQYNSDYAYTGNVYRALPTDAYTISSLTSVLKSGKTSSDPLSLSIIATKLQRHVHYLLPIRLKSLSAGKFDSSLSLAYFKIDTLYVRNIDVTSRGVLTVSRDNSGGPTASEGSPKLVDSIFSNKFLFPFVANSWMQLKMDKEYGLYSYSLTTGNDASARDPKDWNLQGSNDGINWTTIDSRRGQTFANRSTTYSFEVNNNPDNNKYSYYRLLIIANGGDGNFQLSEWRLFSFY